MIDPGRYLITGGTSGIGKMCASHLTANGHRVWITGTRQSTLKAALDEEVAEGGTVCDVAQQTQVEAAYAQAADALGDLTGAFLNAGIDGQGKPATEIDNDNFLRVLDVNVAGVLRCAQAAYRAVTRPGVIVINTSVNALRPETDFADYNASKSAALSVAQSLALEWSADDLAVIALAPGYFRSRMTAPYLDDPTTAQELLSHIPARRFGQAHEIGATVEFLLSGAAQFLSGACVPIAGARNV